MISCSCNLIITALIATHSVKRYAAGICVFNRSRGSVEVARFAGRKYYRTFLLIPICENYDESSEGKFNLGFISSESS